MITTPEQMREAAIAAMKQKCWEDREMKLAGRIETAIRAIPIAPQPSVTVKPSAARGALGELARISLTAANCDAPNIGYYDYIAVSALTIQPADPMSDPRVVALVEALKRWRHGGCPNCLGDCSSANPPVTSCIMQETSAALRAIGGEA